jgi:sporulation protein YlmC with PRC-barrel domain
MPIRIDWGDRYGNNKPRENMKNRAIGVVILSLSLGLAIPLALSPVQAQTKEVQIVKVDPSMIKSGFRASKLIGSHVTNEKNEKIGEIDEIIIDASNKATFAVLEVGGFLGLGAHKIAVPYESLKIDPAGKRIDLPGSTKESLKALPEITYEQ